MIHFENIGEIEALDVFVTDVLDASLDASTLETLTPGASFDPGTRTLRWELFGINLPPGEGGSVLYAVRPLPGLPSGTIIGNTAEIQFEVFDPITTNEVVNIIDDLAPEGIMDPLPANSPRWIPLSWSGTDVVGEVEEYTIFVSVDGGAFAAFLITSDTSTIFVGEPDRTYGFICIAKDTAGNAEVQDPVAEATTITTDPLDTSPPLLTIDLVTSPTDIPAQVITGTVSDPVVDVVFSGIAGVDVNGFPATVIAGTYSAVVPLDEGLNDIFVVAIDNAGNETFEITQIFLDTNQPPVADAGEDPPPVNEQAPVALDGSGSFDPDTDPLTYDWTQVAGPGVTLNTTDPVHPTFVAPSVPVGGATLTFQLVVDDGQVASEPAIVNITVKNVNHVPLAEAGDEQTVMEDSPATLDGSDSCDEDDDPLTFSWVQMAGPAVTLSDPSADQPTFVAPFVGAAGETLTFELTVSDGIDCSSDTVNVIVENVNHPPSAEAGPEQTREEGKLVTLDGTGSSDPDNDSLTHSWVQTAGPTVALSDPSSPTSTFTAPEVVGVPRVTLGFELTVDDGLGGSANDTVVITVLDTNAPPDCELAQPDSPSLWPPNHKLVPVKIVGVSDPDDEDITITIVGVTQDEPLDGLGDGDTAPDAVIQGDTVLLRAERGGVGNGRVYRIAFEADDGVGGVCSGSVTVCVPHDKGQGSNCIDDGQLYDSLGP